MELRTIIDEAIAGKISSEKAETLINEYINRSKYEDLGYAKLDLDRKKRQGAAEVVFCEGKPDEYLTGIFKSILEADGEVLGTRASKEQYELIRQAIPQIEYNPVSRILKIAKQKELAGSIAICTGGTSDIPVAEEAAETAEFLGNHVERVYDVGVAGIHRLFSQKERIEKANVVIAVAGMEGALASVVAGLVNVPVIAVPTSIGYGASFGGLAALLAMLNSCSNGVSVVNIDNGFGAGYIASRINAL
jgi:hypothetical protein